jgi:hypothetical protein
LRLGEQKRSPADDLAGLRIFVDIWVRHRSRLHKPVRQEPEGLRTFLRFVPDEATAPFVDPSLKVGLCTSTPLRRMAT